MNLPITAREPSRVLTEFRTGRLYTEVLPWFSLLLEPQTVNGISEDSRHEGNP